MLNQQHFEGVVIDHGETVLRVCRVLVGRLNADEAWVRTFVGAMRNYPDLPSETNIRAWLIQITHDVAAELNRNGSRAPVGKLIGFPGNSVFDPLDDDIQFAAALARLPLTQRHAVVYHYVADLPDVEVAGILGVDTAFVRRAAEEGFAALWRAAEAAPGHTGSRGE